MVTKLLVAGIADHYSTFTITDTKLYSLVVTLSTYDNVKLLKQLKSGFFKKNNWNKYQTKKTLQTRNQYLYFLSNPSFQGIKRLFFYHLETRMFKKVTSDVLFRM